MDSTKKKKRAWLSSEIDYLLDNYGVMDTHAMSVELMRSVSAIKTCARKFGVIKHSYKDRHFEQWQVDIMLSDYPNKRTEDIAKAIGKSTNSVYRKANALGLKKTPEYQQSEASKRFQPGSHIGQRFMFKKGNVPFNAGKKQHEYMSKEAIEKTAATRFKPGQKIWNAKTVGTIELREARTRKNRTEPGYHWIKVKEPNVWEPLHVHIWKKHNGPIKKGNIIVFKDRNVRIYELEYLECITREENMRRNTIHRYPNEIKSAIRTITKLKKAIKQHENN